MQIAAQSRQQQIEVHSKVSSRILEMKNGDDINEFSISNGKHIKMFDSLVSCANKGPESRSMTKYTS